MHMQLVTEINPIIIFFLYQRVNLSKARALTNNESLV